MCLKVQILHFPYATRNDKEQEIKKTLKLLFKYTFKNSKKEAIVI